MATTTRAVKRPAATAMNVSEPAAAPPAASGDSTRRVAPGVLDNVRVTDFNVQHWFSNHPMDTEQAEKVDRVQKAAAAFAQVITNAAPNCADRTAALRKVREASMTANAAIACRGK